MTSCNILTWTLAFGAEDPRLKHWRSTTWLPMTGLSVVIFK